MKRLFYFISILTFAILVLQGCKNNSKEISNLSTVKEQIKEYHKNGKYDSDLTRIIKKAKEEFAKIDAKNNSLVIFDIDETSLSNYQFGLDYEFGYNEQIWTEWVSKEKATAIKQVKDLYDMLISKGFKVAFITGRNTSHYESTRVNLINQGYTEFDTLITKKLDELKISAVKYKSTERTRLVQKGYEIVGTIGDQFSDLQGPYHGIQVKLPNYQYIVK